MAFVIKCRLKPIGSRVIVKICKLKPIRSRATVKINV